MIKSIVFAAALTGLAQTAAADPGQSKQPDAAATSAAKPAKVRPDGPRYCVMVTETGSRIPTKVCKTRSEWQAEGVDPLAP